MADEKKDETTSALTADTQLVHENTSRYPSTDGAGAEETVTVADREGNEFETPLGADGKNPVSPNNPPAKAVLTEEDLKVIQEESAKIEERQALLAEDVSVNPDQPSEANPSNDSTSSTATNTMDAGDASTESTSKTTARKSSSSK
jgi:hypothetical protein